MSEAEQVPYDQAKYEAERRQRQYQEWGDVIDDVIERYGIDRNEAIEKVADYCDGEVYQAEEQAASEKKDELSEDVSATADQIAEIEGWQEREDEEE